MLQSTNCSWESGKRHFRMINACEPDAVSSWQLFAIEVGLDHDSVALLGVSEF